MTNAVIADDESLLREQRGAPARVGSDQIVPGEDRRRGRWR